MDRDLLDRLWDLADDIDTGETANYGATENIFAEAAQAITDLRRAADAEGLARVWEDWTAYRNATGPVEQADSLLTFSNSFFHYASDILGPDRTVGEPTDYR